MSDLPLSITRFSSLLREITNDIKGLHRRLALNQSSENSVPHEFCCKCSDHLWRDKEAFPEIFAIYVWAWCWSPRCSFDAAIRCEVYVKLRSGWRIGVERLHNAARWASKEQGSRSSTLRVLSSCSHADCCNGCDQSSGLEEQSGRSANWSWGLWRCSQPSPEKKKKSGY